MKLYRMNSLKYYDMVYIYSLFLRERWLSLGERERVDTFMKNWYQVWFWTDKYKVIPK